MRGLRVVGWVTVILFAVGYPVEGGTAEHGGLRWSQRIGSGGSDGVVDAVASSASGDTVFVAGTIGDAEPRTQVIVALEGATGALRWERRWAGPQRFRARAFAVPSDGSAVLAVGSADGAMAVVSIDPGTGEERWVRRVVSPTGAASAAVVARLSPDDGRLFIGGTVRTGIWDFAVAALVTSSGEVEWASYRDGYFADFIDSLDVAPDGERVFVTGPSEVWTEGYDYLTVAYSARTGAELWSATFQHHLHGNDSPTGVVVSPDGATVFVTGHGPGDDLPLLAFSPWAWTTIAYDARTGAERWRATFEGPVKATDFDPWLVLAPDGERLFVAGTTDPSYCDGCGLADLALVAYDTTSGSEVWNTRYTAGPNSEESVRGLAIDPSGRHVHVGMLVTESVFLSGDSAVATFDAATGVIVGSARSDAEPAMIEYVPWYRWSGPHMAIAMDPAGATLFVGMTTEVAYNLERPVQPSSDILVLAYGLGPCGAGAPPSGAVSGPSHQTVEPLTGPGAPFARGVTCEALVPTGL